MKHVTDKIQAWLSGELDPAEARRVEAHLRECPDCAGEAAEARHLWETLGDLAGATPEIPGSIWEPVRERTLARRETGSRFFGPVQLVRSSLATAAVAAGLLLGILVPGTEPGSMDGGAEALDVAEEQVETLWLSGTSWAGELTEFESAWLGVGQDDAAGEDPATERAER